VVEAWDQLLECPSDQAYQAYLVKDNSSEGFQIGFYYRVAKSMRAAATMQSAIEKPDVIHGFGCKSHSGAD